MSRKTVLIAGASGVVGQAALECFANAGDCNVIALSRRPPDVAPTLRFTHVGVDLMDAEAGVSVVASQPAATHLVYAALHEKPDLVAGWRDAQQMATNLAMFCNLLEPIVARGALRHVTLLQGTKAYGVHLHRIPVPARESGPRDAHDNFYWLQEDFLRDAAERQNFSFTIFRPQIIFGDAFRAAMNIIPVLGAYAAICREEKRAFTFPGGASYLLEAVDAGLLARAIHWAGEASTARNQTFNITNGDVFAWRNVWPSIADALGVEAGLETPLSIAGFLENKSDVWERITARHNLRKVSLAALLGQSHHYADFCFAHGARTDPPDVLVSTIKVRQAGFADCMDTEDMFRGCFASMRAKRLLPAV